MGSEWTGKLDLMRTIAGLYFLLYRGRNFMRTTNLFPWGFIFVPTEKLDMGWGRVVGGWWVGGGWVGGSILHF